MNSKDIVALKEAREKLYDLSNDVVDTYTTYMEELNKALDKIDKIVSSYDDSAETLNDIKISEKDKSEIVFGKFRYAITDFSVFERGKSYWLEYIGDDTYYGRSDNILNMEIKITPLQLIRYFSETPLDESENELSDFVMLLRTWTLTNGESNKCFCDVMAHENLKHLREVLCPPKRG